MAAEIGISEGDDIHGEYKREIAALKNEIVELKKTVAALTERLGRDSSNSHLPPSRDSSKSRKTRKAKKAVAAAKKKAKKANRKRGGQPGRKGKNRSMLPPEQVDKFVSHVPGNCGGCGSSLRKKPNAADPPPIRHQVLELPEKLLDVVEHQIHARLCGSCGEVTRADLPSEVPRICSGPRLQAFSALLSAHFRCSKRDVRDFFQMVFGKVGRISLGTISNHEQRTSEALAQPYKEAVEAVARENLIHADETSWPEEGVCRFLWTAVASLIPITVFAIARRTREAFEGFMVGFNGTAHVDRFASYAHLGDRRCFCWAHLKRDFEKLKGRGGVSKKIAEACLRVHRDVFKAWHRFEAGKIDRAGLQAQLDSLKPVLKKTLKLGVAEKGTEKHGQTASFCQNLINDFSCLWHFAEVEGGRPTNNSAERSIRHGVILRKVSYGTQSKRGSRFIERMLTVIETCRRQDREVLAYLAVACEAKLKGKTPPSLLPSELKIQSAPT